MSYTTIYLADGNGKLGQRAEFQNSWGSLPMIWDYLHKKYIRDERRCTRYTDWTFDPDAWIVVGPGKIVALHEDKRLARWELALLMCTFDGAVLDRSHFAMFATDCLEFYKAAGRPAHSQLEKWAMLFGDHVWNPDITAAVWQHSSCGPECWAAPDPDDAEEWHLINIETEGHLLNKQPWSIYPEITRLSGEQSCLNN